MAFAWGGGVSALIFRYSTRRLHVVIKDSKAFRDGHLLADVIENIFSRNAFASAKLIYSYDISP